MTGNVYTYIYKIKKIKKIHIKIKVFLFYVRKNKTDFILVSDLWAPMYVYFRTVLKDFLNCISFIYLCHKKSVTKTS